MMKNILIIGAHYDDAELGAAGTAAKLLNQGMNVYKLTLTDNVTDFKQKNIVVRNDTSVKESARACEILGGVIEIDFAPLECCKLEYTKETMQRIEKIIYDYQIDTVFIHHPEDMNNDHIVASRLSITAARHCENIFTYQSNVYQLERPFTPRVFVDISDFIDQKREALMQYGTEHNRFSKLFQTNIERNHIWGYSNEVEYAEGFDVVKGVIG